MNNLFQGLLGPSPQDVLAEQQDRLNMQLSGMQNPYERLGLLLGTAFMGDPRKSQAYQAAQAQQDEISGIANDPIAKANYLRQAVADGRIPLDKLKQVQQAIDFLDPQQEAETLSIRDISSLRETFTPESVQSFIETGDQSVLVNKDNVKLARAVSKDDADWEAFKGSELTLGEKFYDDLLEAYGPRRFADWGEDERLDAVRSNLYNTALSIAASSDKQLTREEALKEAKKRVIATLREADQFSDVSVGSPSSASGNTASSASAPIDTIPQGNPVFDEPRVEGVDLPRDIKSIELEIEKLKNTPRSGTREANAKRNKRLAELNRELSKAKKRDQPQRTKRTR